MNVQMFEVSFNYPAPTSENPPVRFIDRGFVKTVEAGTDYRQLTSWHRLHLTLSAACKKDPNT